MKKLVLYIDEFSLYFYLYDNLFKITRT